MKNPKPKGNKVVLKIFDASTGVARKPHTCPVCNIYKMEIKKGNSDALAFYKSHLNDVARKYGGVTFALDIEQKKLMLPSAKE